MTQKIFLNHFLIFVIFLFFFLAAMPCMLSAQKISERQIPVRDRTYRIGVLSFIHETCTYCPEPAGLEDWLATGPATDRFLGQTTGYTGGF